MKTNHLTREKRRMRKANNVYLQYGTDKIRQGVKTLSYLRNQLNQKGEISCSDF